jgi:hypothetical protein
VAVAICYHQVFAEDRARFARQMDHLLRWTYRFALIIPNFS